MKGQLLVKLSGGLISSLVATSCVTCGSFLVNTDQLVCALCTSSSSSSKVKSAHAMFSFLSYLSDSRRFWLIFPLFTLFCSIQFQNVCGDRDQHVSGTDICRPQVHSCMYLLVETKSDIGQLVREYHSGCRWSVLKYKYTWRLLNSDNGQRPG